MHANVKLDKISLKVLNMLWKENIFALFNIAPSIILPQALCSLWHHIGLETTVTTEQIVQGSCYATKIEIVKM